MVTRQQVRAARGALGISAETLAELAGVTRPVVSRYEGGKQAQSDTLLKLRKALESKGVEFISTNTISWREDQEGE